MRDGWEEFMEFLKENRNKIEPIVYTSGVKEYADLMIGFLDPKKEIF